MSTLASCMFTCSFPPNPWKKPRSNKSAGYQRRHFGIIHSYYINFQWPFTTMAFAMDNYISVKTFADSYMKFRYFQSNKYETKHNSNIIYLQPHVILENGNEITEVKFYNHAIGGNTMKRILEDKVNIGVWARNLPKITLLHVGACDIANLDIGRDDRIRYKFNDYVQNFLTQFKAIGRERLDKKRLIP